MSVYYPELLQIIENKNSEYSSIILDLKFPSDLIYFSGHFDAKGILPGIAQIDLAIHYAHEYLALKKEKVGVLKQVKFTTLITPEMRLSLAITLKKDLLEFRYYTEDTTYSLGVISLQHHTGIAE